MIVLLGYLLFQALEISGIAVRKVSTNTTFLALNALMSFSKVGKIYYSHQGTVCVHTRGKPFANVTMDQIYPFS